MKRENIVNELKRLGYEVIAKNVEKNGVTFQAIIMGNGSMRPTIYVDYLLDWDLEDAIEEIINVYEKAMEDMPQIPPVNEMTEWDKIKTRLMLCLQKRTTENIIKRGYLDLELCVRVVIDENSPIGVSTYKVTPTLLEKFGVSEDVLFHAAWDCTKPKIEITDMAQILKEMGMNVPMDKIPMIVATNKAKLHGAIAMYDAEKLLEIANRYNSDLAILPSSIHEILLVPIDETTDFEVLDNMVQEVNATEVAPEEVLSNQAYRFNRNERTVTYHIR